MGADDDEQGMAQVSDQLPDDFRVPDDLSSLLDGDDDTTALPSTTGGPNGSVMVIAGIDLPPGSPYVTQVMPSDDVVIQLPAEQAVAYGMAVLEVAHRAHYLAAVLAQARAVMNGRGKRPPIGEAEENARFLLKQLIEDLPELDDTATAPLRFVPTIHSRSHRALIRVSLPPHDTPFSGWSFDDACTHAMAVLGQSVVSRLDTAYRNTIAVRFDAGEQSGRAAVHDLGNFFQHHDPLASSRPRVPGPPPGARPAGGKKKRRR